MFFVITIKYVMIRTVMNMHVRIITYFIVITKNIQGSVVF
jgi:hypothetical protein